MKIKINHAIVYPKSDGDGTFEPYLVSATPTGFTKYLVQEMRQHLTETLSSCEWEDDTLAIKVKEFCDTESTGMVTKFEAITDDFATVAIGADECVGWRVRIIQHEYDTKVTMSDG